MPDTMKGAAIILAAGRSRRMGRDKAGLLWKDGEPLASWMSRSFLDIELQPVLVFGPHNIALGRKLVGSEFAHQNAHADEGRVGSLRVGLHAAAEICGVLAICGIDQPRPPELLRHLCEIALENPNKIVVPYQQGHRGHPVFFGADARPHRDALDEKSFGLRGWLDAHSELVLRVPTSSPQPDLNTPDDYQRAVTTIRDRRIED